VAADLLAAARRLASAGKGRPAQPYLKRAVSTAYYALFEALARECADSFLGTGARARPAWAQVHRALDHGFARNACSQAENLGFPTGLLVFADTFIELQQQRYKADYDPTARFSREETIDIVNRAEAAIRSLRSATRDERRYFAVLVLLRRR
jgi:uncharacterized protein (UPF0332 family)